MSDATLAIGYLKAEQERLDRAVLRDDMDARGMENDARDLRARAEKHRQESAAIANVMQVLRSTPDPDRVDV